MRLYAVGSGVKIILLYIMFRIAKGYENIAKTVRLPVPLLEKLERLAYKNNLSFNQLVVQCLNYAIENLMDDNCIKEE